MNEVAAISDRLRQLALHQPAQQLVEGWKDIPLASEASEQQLKWLAEFRIPKRQVTVIALPRTPTRAC